MQTHSVLRTEITVNYQHRDAHLECAYIVVTRERQNGVRSVELSRHIAGTDERLVDLVTREVQQLTLDYALAYVEPF